MTRTFLAIELHDDVRAVLARETARLARAMPMIRWGDPDSIHLTLAFLGELDDAQLTAATEAAREIAPRFAPFSLALGRLGAFGPPHAPRVVWVGVAGQVPGLLALQDALAGALEVRGFPREARPFAPHLTLARIKSPLPPPTLAALLRLFAAPPAANASWLVGEIAVMKSELLRPAARYIRLASAPLGAPNA